MNDGSGEEFSDAAKDPTLRSDVRAAHPFIGYTIARIALFVVVLGLLYLVGARGLLLLALALLVSGLLSFFLLSRQRDRMSGALVNRPHRSRLRDRLNAGARSEDDEED